MRFRLNDQSNKMNCDVRIYIVSCSHGALYIAKQYKLSSVIHLDIIFITFLKEYMLSNCYVFTLSISHIDTKEVHFALS